MKPGSTITDLKETILKWYDGYVFDWKTPFNESSLDKVTRVLNPFSINNFFNYRLFSNYWLRSGPPTFLAKLIAQDPDSFVLNNLPRGDQETLTGFPLDPIDPISLSFQTGYLTLKSVSLANQEPYNFKIPNLEVEIGYPKAFFQTFFGQISKKIMFENAQKFKKAIINRDYSAIEEIIGVALTKVSSDQHISLEKLYHYIIKIYIYALQIDVRPQVASSMGRSDLDLVLPTGHYVIIEIKFEKDLSKSPIKATSSKHNKAMILAQKALDQIATKEYSKQYRLSAKETIEMGIGVYGRSTVGVKFVELKK
jgi:hypothetical protein